ncbi:MAG: HTH-type transcriptional activator IlvY [Spirochaetales bacterium]|nr:HTH-type transcriptional activator IlvY [Spirochaetales bacterium]
MHLSQSLHFNRTAEACHISPPGLTRAIQKLEEEAGTVLFQRDNRQVNLTPAGQMLRVYAKAILENWEGFQQQLAQSQGEIKGRIRLFCSVTASYSLLRPILQVFREKYPQVHILLQTGEAAQAINMVKSGDADLVIAARPDNLDSSLEFQNMVSVPLIFIAPQSHKWESLNSSHPHWEEIPFILPAHGLSRYRMDKWFKKNRLTPSIYAEVAGNEAIIAMVGLGCGIGIVPELVLKESSLAMEVRSIEPQPKLDPYEVGFCVRSKSLSSPIVAAFWALTRRGL